jgi:hypothetical protein
MRALAVIGIVAVLLAGGMAAVVVAADGGSTMDGTSTTLSATGTYNLTASVAARVEGLTISITGADVTVYTVSVTNNSTTTVITITKVAEATSDADGNATFQLAAGGYILVAQYQGLVGIQSINLTQDSVVVTPLHNLELMNMEQMNNGMERGRHCPGPRIDEPTGFTVIVDQ